MNIKYFLCICFLDREAVQELDAKLKEERKQSGEMVINKIAYRNPDIYSLVQNRSNSMKNVNDNLSKILELCMWCKL